MAFRIYNTGLKVGHLGRAVEAWFHRRGYETQLLEDGQSIVMQAKKGGTLAGMAGMSYALTVWLRPREGGVEVETGSGRWLDKAAVGAVGWLAFFPLAVTAGIGVYNQSKLSEELLTFLELYVAEVHSE